MLSASSDEHSPPVTRRGANSSDWGDVPELPNANHRWTVRRKATVIMAVRGGWVPIEEICDLYNLSVDEFLAWERDMDRNGVPGLRSTRYQIYRDTDIRNGVQPYEATAAHNSVELSLPSMPAPRSP